MILRFRRDKTRKIVCGCGQVYLVCYDTDYEVLEE